MMRSSSVWVLLAAVVAMPACAGADEDDESNDVSAVLESGDTSSLAQSLAVTAGTPVELAEQVARHALGALHPQDCATRWRDQAHLHLQLNDCTGPFGKRKLTGGIDFDVRLEGGQATADIKGAGDLTANGKPFSYDGTVSWKIGATDFHWTAHAVGTTPRGRAFDKTSTLDLSLEPASLCSTLQGTVTGTVDGRAVDVHVSDYRVCGSQCPASGEITKTKEAKKGVKVRHVSFDGTDEARVVTPSGVIRTIPLVCGEDAE
jgi:hypothetical protein